MLLSIALILLTGLIVGSMMEKIKIPRLVGMIIVGLIIGPYALNLIDDSFLNISNEIRQIALVVILTRAGLSLNIADLKKIGRPAFLICFIPATFEIIGTTIFGPILLGITTFESLLLGAVLGAVSPAIIIPRMLKLKEEGYGINKQIPDLILAGASVDDVYVIVLFYSFLGLVENNVLELHSFFLIPISIILGIILGVIVGFILSYIFKKFKINLTYKLVIVLCSSFLMITLENLLKNYILVSSLLGVIAMGIVLGTKNKKTALELEESYNALWKVFEIFLFVLVGASVNIAYALNAGINIIILILIALLFRTIGVLVSLIKTELSVKEKLFSVISYLPKATVQASIGGIALSQGLAAGDIILSVAVASILITAPLGAFLIDISYKKLLIFNNY